MKVERVVLDTNVLISAALSPHGKPFACLSWVLSNAVLVTSPDPLNELETRLARPKFDKYLDDALRRTFVAEVAANATVVEAHGVIRVSRDPDDDKLLEVAVGGGAHCLISGDQDLLILNPFQGIPILSPATFLEQIAKTGA